MHRGYDRRRTVGFPGFQVVALVHALTSPSAARRGARRPGHPRLVDGSTDRGSMFSTRVYYCKPFAIASQARSSQRGDPPRADANRNPLRHGRRRRCGRGGSLTVTPGPYRDRRRDGIKGPSSLNHLRAASVRRDRVIQRAVDVEPPPSPPARPGAREIRRGHRGSGSRSRREGDLGPSRPLRRPRPSWAHRRAGCLRRG